MTSMQLTDAIESSREERLAGYEWERLRKKVIQRDHGRCTEVIDGKRCNSKDRIEVDHIIPLAMGGPNELKNLRCRCNYHHKFKTAEDMRLLNSAKRINRRRASITRELA